MNKGNAFHNDLDAAWERALSGLVSKVDALTAKVCADLEPQLSDLPTWEQLAPLYGMEDA